MDQAGLIERYNLTPHPKGAGLPKCTARAARSAPPPGIRVSAWLSRDLLSAVRGGVFRLSQRDQRRDLDPSGRAPLELALLDPAPRLLRLSAPAKMASRSWWSTKRAAGRPQPRPYTLTSCLVAPGFDFDDFRMPGAAELIAATRNRSS